jgi:hypothetical protein
MLRTLVVSEVTKLVICELPGPVGVTDGIASTSIGSGARSEREKAARRGDGSGAAEAPAMLLLPWPCPFGLGISDVGTPMCETVLTVDEARNEPT